MLHNTVQMCRSEEQGHYPLRRFQEGWQEEGQVQEGGGDGGDGRVLRRIRRLSGRQRGTAVSFIFSLFPLLAIN